MSLHRFLSQLEWGEGVALSAMEFLVVDRGTEGGTRKVSCPELVGRDRSYLHLAGGGRVPYHRVLEVWAGGRLVWSRERSGVPEDPQ